MEHCIRNKYNWRLAYVKTGLAERDQTRLRSSCSHVSIFQSLSRIRLLPIRRHWSCYSVSFIGMNRISQHLRFVNMAMYDKPFWHPVISFQLSRNRSSWLRVVGPRTSHVRQSCEASLYPAYTTRRQEIVMFKHTSNISGLNVFRQSRFFIFYIWMHDL